MSKFYGSRPTEDKALSNVTGRLRQRAEAKKTERGSAWSAAWQDAEKWVKDHAG
jgi:hypothetical protein